MAGSGADLPASAAAGPEDGDRNAPILGEINRATRIDMDNRSRTITMRDTPEHLALAGELTSRQRERGPREVMVEIEIS